ncbi:MAG: type II secretion system F family protein [Patescibacteria group bacterium]
MKFSYTAKTKAGDTITGIEEAADKFDLARRLRTVGSLVVRAEEAKGNKGVSLSLSFGTLFKRVKLEEKIFFTTNLSAMLSAGLSLARALDVLTRQTKNPVLLAVIEATAHDIDKGSSLSEALGRHPEVFPEVFTAMVAAGEGSGKLPDSLRLIGEQLSKTYALRKKIRGALIYPAIIVTAMVLVGILMLTFIVPTLSATFEELHITLPLSTRLIIGLSHFVERNGIYLLLALPFIGYAFLRMSRSEKGKRSVDTFLIHAPLVSPIVRNMNAAMTSRTLSSLVSSGVEIVQALDITKKVIQNSYYRAVLTNAQKSVEKGGTLASAFLAEAKLYPTLLGEMIDVGEETGALSDMLLRVAVFYEGEVDTVTKDLSTVIEPILMVFVGAAVLFFAISMIQPIYNISAGI